MNARKAVYYLRLIAAQILAVLAIPFSAIGEILQAVAEWVQPPIK